MGQTKRRGGLDTEQASRKVQTERVEHMSWALAMRNVLESRRALLMLTLLVLSGCGTRTLKMPILDTKPAPNGQAIYLSVSDSRATTVLGKVDSFTINSGASLVQYVEAELANGLSRMGIAAWQRAQDAQGTSPARKRLVASIESAGLEAESTLLHPVVAFVRLRTELVDELGQTTFSREFHGSTSRELGFHRQGGPEDAALLVEAVEKAVAGLSSDGSFAAALEVSAEDAERIAAREQAAREAARVEGRRSAEEAAAAKERQVFAPAGAESRGDPDGCQGGHSVSSLADDGRLVVLEDGSVWEVDLVDTVDTALWKKGEGVLLCGSRMINTRSGERVSVGPLN